MTTIAGEQAVKLVKGTASGVFIESAKVEEVLVNKVIKVSMPIVDPATRSPGALVKDLKRFEHLFVITGFVSASSGSGNEGFGSAKAVKDHLIKNIFYPAGDIELHYRSQADSDYGSKYWDNSLAKTTYVKVSLDKISFGDDNAVGGQDAAYPPKYKVVMNLFRGKEK